MSKKRMGSTPLPSFVLAAGMLLAVGPLRGQGNEIQKAPLSSSFKSWVDKHRPRGVPGPMGGTKEGGQRVRGRIPHPVDLSHIHGPVFRRTVGDPPFPAFYDLRTSGSLTPVKDSSTVSSNTSRSLRLPLITTFSM